LSRAAGRKRGSTSKRNGLSSSLRARRPQLRTRMNPSPTRLRAREPIKAQRKFQKPKEGSQKEVNLVTPLPYFIAKGKEKGK